MTGPAFDDLLAAFEIHADRGGNVIHATSAWRDSGDELVSLAINADTPQSPVDSTVLRLARARADAIVTTGKILRAEPSLQHVLDPRADAALLAWRADVLGKTAAPTTVILTSRPDVDVAHPIFEATPRPLIYTSTQAAPRLAQRVEAAGVEVVADPHASLRSAIRNLRSRFATILVEAGATTTGGLYREPRLVDELMLSIYEEPELAAAARGPALPPLSTLTAGMHAVGEVVRVRERSGRWSFRRFVRSREADS